MGVDTQTPRTPSSQRSRSTLSAMEIRPRPSITKWISIVVLVYLVFLGLEFIVFNSRWNWPLVFDYLFSQRILTALLNTIILTVLSVAFGLALGLVTAWARLSDYRVFRLFAAGYIWITRATPLLVILLFVFFLGALAPTLGISIPFVTTLFETPTSEVITRFTAAIIGLSVYLGGKAAEVFRSGIIAIDEGQFEACRSLGLGPWTTMVKVVGPQTIRVITPPMANEVITMFKNTSLVSVIGYAELLTTVKLIYSNNFETIPLLTVAVIWYLALTSIAMYGQQVLENRFSRGFSRKASARNALKVSRKKSKSSES